MHFEYITSSTHPLYEQALELYRNSFPVHEQRERASQDSILAYSNYRFGLVFDAATFVGLALFWQTDSLIYVEHLCIRPELRNRRYGQRVLDMLATHHLPVILEIDPPLDDISMRRKRFYERCGFFANDFSHVHPPYHAGLQGHALVVMSSPAPIPPETYQSFNRLLCNTVMHQAYPTEASSKT